MNAGNIFSFLWGVFPIFIKNETFFSFLSGQNYHYQAQLKAIENVSFSWIFLLALHNSPDKNTSSTFIEQNLTRLEFLPSFLFNLWKIR